MANPICLRLFVHWIRRAASRADCTAGSSSAIKTAMIAITTKSSMSVKPDRFRFMAITPLRKLVSDRRTKVVEVFSATPGRATVLRLDLVKVRENVVAFERELE